MPNVFQLDKAQDCQLTNNIWARVRNAGIFKDDIALIHSTEKGTNKVWVRLIPRVETQTTEG
jgi:hypothetical protein